MFILEVNMSLYKYTAIKPYSKSNLENNQLYLQSPKMFNDPYEFIFKFDIADEVFLDFIKLIYGDMYTEFKEKNISKEQVLDYTRDHYFSESWSLLGATCLTENANDDIMWAHYGGNHKGICIEFDKSKAPFNLFKKVEYTSKISTIQIDDLASMDMKIIEAFKANLFRKHNIWSYENEWRYVSEVNSFVEYEPQSILSITFGFFCDDNLKAEILESTSHLSLKYFEVVRSKDSYEIEKRPFLNRWLTLN